MSSASSDPFCDVSLKLIFSKTSGSFAGVYSFTSSTLISSLTTGVDSTTGDDSDLV